MFQQFKFSLSGTSILLQTEIQPPLLGIIDYCCQTSTNAFCTGHENFGQHVVNSEPNPTKEKAPRIKEASAKPRDENKDPMPRNGPSPRNFGMNPRTAKLPANEIIVQLLVVQKTPCNTRRTKPSIINLEKGKAENDK